MVLIKKGLALLFVLAVLLGLIPCLAGAGLYVWLF